MSVVAVGMVLGLWVLASVGTSCLFTAAVTPPWRPATRRSSLVAGCVVLAVTIYLAIGASG